MPVSDHGQLVTFATVGSVTGQTTPWRWFVVTEKYNTCSKIATRYGDNSQASAIVSCNSSIKLGKNHFLNNPRTKLPLGTKVRIPNWLADPNNPDLNFSTLLQDMAPITVADGYAMFDVVDRPAQLGFSRFDGYDPIQLSIPLHFEGYANDRGGEVERRIQTLEAMAGRGIKAAKAGKKPPPPIKVYALNRKNKAVPVVPKGYGWEPSNPNAPTYSVCGIDWTGDDLRDTQGRRIRSTCTVTVQQDTSTVARLSAAQRNKTARDGS